ncbi:peptidylprolyl isomerase [Macrococcoides caseolyticum subsp. hominis]|uniref:peptidylprolyl isomerase n=1 Tax=Macrococcoides caseolyticum TaxID=69966 RepID=UPI000C146528|nr:foldase protein PrsA [Macrococcus caseolyticus]RAI79595.1 peptidylprolyl isomerase [Macrococcus caseolyticus subsp. hominis]
MTNLKKIMMPAALSVSILGLAACGNGGGETLVSSKAGDVKQSDIMKELGNEQIAKTSFQLIFNDVLKEKYGKKIDEDKINKETDKEIKKYGDEKTFEQILQQQSSGMTVEQYKKKRVTDEYQKQFLNDTIKISDKDIKDNAKKASHILIAVKSDSNKDGLSDKEAKAKAEEILKQVKANKDDFKKIAKKESDDTQSAKNNGELGYVVKGQTVEAFEKALFKLKPGEISNIVKTEFGYHIIMAEDDKDIAKEKDKLAQTIRQNKLQDNPKLYVQAVQKLFKEYDVDFKDKDIKKYVDNQILKAK